MSRFVLNTFRINIHYRLVNLTSQSFVTTITWGDKTLITVGYVMLSTTVRNQPTNKQNCEIHGGRGHRIHNAFLLLYRMYSVLTTISNTTCIASIVTTTTNINKAICKRIMRNQEPVASGYPVSILIAICHKCDVLCFFVFCEWDYVLMCTA